MSDPRERIARFDRELTERLSTRTERCRFGTAYFHEGYPRRWDSNFVWVQAPLDGVQAEDLVADADDLLGRAGVAHRLVAIDDRAQGERLAAGFVSLGYEVDRDVTMLHAREPDQWTDDRAEEIDLATAKRFFVAANLQAAHRIDAADARMLADFRDVIVERVETRFFGAREAGEVVAGCEMYRLGDVAQVEDVFTLAEHRGKGLGRAVVLAAVRAAYEAGADLVHLYADDEDWPKQLYAKLGFDELSRAISFVRASLPQRS